MYISYIVYTYIHKRTHRDHISTCIQEYNTGMHYYTFTCVALHAYQYILVQLVYM